MNGKEIINLISLFMKDCYGSSTWLLIGRAFITNTTSPLVLEPLLELDEYSEKKMG